MNHNANFHNGCPKWAGLGHGSATVSPHRGYADEEGASITFAANNGFAPRVAKNGTGKLTVRGNATFGNPTIVWPSAEPGAPSGRFEILEVTGTITNPDNVRFATDPDPLFWNLRREGNSYRLRHSHPATVVIVR